MQLTPRYRLETTVELRFTVVPERYLSNYFLAVCRGLTFQTYYE